MDAEAAMADAEGQWRNVPRPTTEELLAPSTQVVDTPSIPRAVKIIGIMIVLVLLLLSVWLGLSLGRSGTNSPDPTPTPTVDEALCHLEAPTQVGRLVRGDVKSTPKASDDDRDILTTTYTDGTDKIVLVLSCPEKKLSSYLENAGVPNAEPVEGSDGISCGILSDDDIPVCARIFDDTAIAVAGLSEQGFPSLTSLVKSFHEEMQ